MPYPQFEYTESLALPEPALTVETIREPVISTITVKESKRLASIVVSALVVHFGTHESLQTWPECLENHIASFLHLAQLPVDYVSSALTLISAFSQDNPYLYAEFDDAEGIFWTAMVHVQQRMQANDYLATKYRRHRFEFQDRRWRQDTFDYVKKKMFVWFDGGGKEYYIWSNRLDLATFLDDMDDTPSSPEDVLQKRIARGWYFDTVIAEVFTRCDSMDETSKSRWKTAGRADLFPAVLQCQPALSLCALDRGDLYPIIDDEESGLPVNYEFRPWHLWDNADYKHVKHGILDKWTQVHDPRYNPKKLFVNMYAMGPYQRVYVQYSREKEYWNEMNEEEWELLEEYKETEWARDFFIQLPWYRPRGE